MRKSVNKIAIPIATIALAASAAGMSAFASGVAGSGDQAQGADRPGPTAEEREASDRAIENGDYEAWKEVVGDRGIANQINEDNFEAFAEAHALMKSGDHEGARAIMDELGIEPPHGKHGHGPRFDDETRAALDAALDSRDYAAWAEIAGDKPIADQVNEENFDRFAEAHELREAGDHEGAREIMDELGIEKPEGRHGRGPHGHMDDDGPEGDVLESEEVPLS